MLHGAKDCYAWYFVTIYDKFYKLFSSMYSKCRHFEFEIAVNECKILCCWLLLMGIAGSSFWQTLLKRSAWHSRMVLKWLCINESLKMCIVMNTLGTNWSWNDCKLEKVCKCHLKQYGNTINFSCYWQMARFNYTLNVNSSNIERWCSDDCPCK